MDHRTGAKIMDPMYALKDTSELLSPSLLIFRDLVRKNLLGMIEMARGPERLRPHVKTHKMADVVQMSIAEGITKHKCATIAEAEMVAASGGTDVLLAYPLVGPNVKRFARLAFAYPESTFRATVDDAEAARALSRALSGVEQPVPTLVDLDLGMGRTGIDPGPPAEELYRLIAELPNLVPDGIHAYDGHIHTTDLDERRRAARPGQEMALGLRDRLLAQGLPVPRLVMGGTPTFPIHAELDVPGVECSPGTTVFHDHGYGSRYPDLPFTPAALLLTRVISHPRPGRLCLDLGHKAVAADPAGQRLVLPDIPDARFVVHSEEHLVIETARDGEFPPGSTLLAIPTHICPTCALHRRVYVIDGGGLVDEWEVQARDRVLVI
jgi:D-serine deaminase-like pyridoxal phosphate-dependent protein